MTGEFSVCQFFEDGSYEYVGRNFGPLEAVETAKRYTETVAARTGITRRVIITDGGDYTNFEWRYGQGVIYPPNDGKQFVAEGTAS